MFLVRNRPWTYHLLHFLREHDSIRDHHGLRNPLHDQLSDARPSVGGVRPDVQLGRVRRTVSRGTGQCQVLGPQQDLFALRPILRRQRTLR